MGNFADLTMSRDLDTQEQRKSSQAPPITDIVRQYVNKAACICK